MARFDVFRLGTRRQLVLDVQADRISGLETRVVAPLMSVQPATRPVRRLNPVLEFDGVRLFLRTQQLAAIEIRNLGRPIGNLARYQDDILVALDMLFTGF